MTRPQVQTYLIPAELRDSDLVCWTRHQDDVVLPCISGALFKQVVYSRAAH